MNAALVKIDVAAADLGKSVNTLFEMAEGGTLIERGLLWVFDFSNGDTDRRDLRFWRPEILVCANKDVALHTKFRGWELDWVLARILPVKRTNFHAGEVNQLFQLRPRTRIDFGEELNGKMKGGCNFYSRAVLVKFLTARWLGTGGARLRRADKPLSAPEKDTVTRRNAQCDDASIPARNSILKTEVPHGAAAGRETRSREENRTQGRLNQNINHQTNGPAAQNHRRPVLISVADAMLRRALTGET